VWLSRFVTPRFTGAWPGRKNLAARLAIPVSLVILATLIEGCAREDPSNYTTIAKPPSVRLIQPEPRNIVRVVGQPSFVEAYERTSIYPKFTAYIDNWVVDIGDKVKKDDVLATLFVPELLEEFETKKATVKLDEERITLAQKVVDVAAADVKAAEAQLEEANQILAKYQSEMDRWDTEVKRLQREVNRGVVDPQILLESTNQLRSSTAARNAAQATIAKAAAQLLSQQETLAKAKVDVAVAQADLAVATSEWRKTGAMVGYLTLRAPFDGIIYERNANTFDFVLPSTGDPTALRRAPDVSSAGAAPVYVVDRIDIVRIFVDIPEQDADYVHGVDLRLVNDPSDLRKMPETGRNLVVLARLADKLHFRFFDSEGKRVVDAGEETLRESAEQLPELKGLLKDLWDQPPVGPPRSSGDGVWDKIPGAARQISPIVKGKVLTALSNLFGPERVPTGTKAKVLVQAFRDHPVEGSVTRTSWALNIKSRTLRAEVDLDNTDNQILPGMYAYASVLIERPHARAIPVDALVYQGDQTYCWLYKDGHATRTAVRTGISDGEWIEVTNLEHAAATKGDAPWKPIDGSEQIIVGDLSVLADGAAVEVTTDSSTAKVASSTPPAGATVNPQ
jgi:multidrug efflux pump subunit AcrA (membrane-fusion protein)